MSTLAVVEEILRETQVPMSVRQIVEVAGDRLPTKSKTPDTVVARDLSMDIKKRGEASLFVRSSPGRYTLRELHLRKLAEQQGQEQAVTPGDGHAHEPNQHGDLRGDTTPVLSSAMRADRAATLPAKKPAPADEQTGTVHQ